MIQNKSKQKDKVFSILFLGKISFLGASGSSSSPLSPVQSCWSDPHPQLIYFWELEPREEWLPHDTASTWTQVCLTPSAVSFV